MFREALNNRDYRGVLKIFNEKGVAASVGDKLGIDKREYQGKVINLLRGACRDEIINAIEGYLPNEIPRIDVDKIPY